MECFEIIECKRRIFKYGADGQKFLEIAEAEAFDFADVIH